MATGAPELTAEFSRWYGDSFMPNDGDRQARLKGATDLVGLVTWEMVEVLVRLAMPSNAPASGAKAENFAESYQKVLLTLAGGGPALDPVHSAREIQVLAAMVLAGAFAHSADAAMGVFTASFGGARAPELPTDLAGLAKRAIGELSRRKHVRISAKDLEVVAPKLAFEVSAEAQQSMDIATWKGELERLRDAATNAIGKAVTAQSNALKKVHRQLALDEEELQMLWWLTGEASSTNDQPFKDVDEAARPLLLGYELSAMTHVAPGPVSIRSLLTRAGVGRDEITLASAINAMDLDWARARSTSTRISLLTTPLHFALEKRGELASNESWQAGWAGMTQLQADCQMPAIDLAELFYFEHLYLHVNS